MLAGGGGEGARVTSFGLSSLGGEREGGVVCGCRIRTGGGGWESVGGGVSADAPPWSGRF